jgi:hypothetical protein
MTPRLAPERDDPLRFAAAGLTAHAGASQAFGEDQDEDMDVAALTICPAPSGIPGQAEYRRIS